LYASTTQNTTFCTPVFAKPPAKTRKAPSTKKLAQINPLRSALLVSGAGFFGDEFRGEAEVILVAGGYEVAEDGVRLEKRVSPLRCSQKRE